MEAEDMKVIGYDVGTTGFKAAIYDITDEDIRLISDEIDSYPLRMLPNGGAEQDPDDWWRAMCRTTRRLIDKTGITAKEIEGLACCSQCCTLVLIDERGSPLRPAMSIMDTRAQEQFRNEFCSGLKVGGFNTGKLLKFLRKTSVAPASSKDTVYKYLWVRDNEPELFERTYKWLDTKEYLNAKATGYIAASRDDAFMTFLYDTDAHAWCDELCGIMGVRRDHLPDLCESTSIIGGLTADAASDLGLEEGTPVISGGTDVSLCQIGSGALLPGDTNICSGTSGWVSTCAERKLLDLKNCIATIASADPDTFLYVADCETAGKCMEWGLERLDKTPLHTFDDMLKSIRDVPAGSNGVLFSPWMHGNRCPFEDANARGLFFNIDVDNHTGDLIKSVIEGVCMHMRWLLEASETLLKTNPVLRFSGGSALSPEVCQILADVTGRAIEVPVDPRQAGTYGAAATIAVAFGLADSIRDIKHMVKIRDRFEPDLSNTSVYDKLFPVFKDLYRNNKDAYKVINEDIRLGSRN